MGVPCKQNAQELLLPAPTPTTSEFIRKETSEISKMEILDPNLLSKRAGFGMATQASPELWAKSLHSGWFISWAVLKRSPSLLPEHWQMVRLKPGCLYPSKEYIAWVAAQYPGNVWIIGNEPDVIWQDGVTSEEYAIVYHEIYYLIKSADPTAKIAVAGISQATPLRIAYLDRILTEYRRLFSIAMPVDWWTIHGFVLREERDSWGVGIPPGMTQDTGELREVSDTGRLDLFIEQIVDFRHWMGENGYRDTPLALTEFGILMPGNYGYPEDVVSKYMQDTFSWLQGTKDEQIGYSKDENRLVQRWAWFSLSDPLYPSPDLADFNTGELTPLGITFREFIMAHNP
ncbi:MAG: hypothetical protein WBV22_11630 [Anaerolineaceae bacterium]